MADRRMFSKKVTEDDEFMELSSSAQALWLHLSMAADDDGFCKQITVSMLRAHASMDDLHSLLEKRYIYQFENGVIVITHWRMANALRKDRYTPTIYQNELAMLELSEQGVYEMVAERLPVGCQVVATDKNRLDKNRLDKVRLEKKEAPYFPDDELLEDAFREFIAMRKQIKKPMTEGAIKRMITKINKLERDVAVKELQRSIDHNWLDIYTDEKPKKASSLWDEWKDV